MRSDALTWALRRVGERTLGWVERMGFAARFSLAVLTHSPAALRRIQLTMREIYFAGVLSLVIIMVSGLFVGMVLALQGYEVLTRYGANESLGVLVALSLGGNSGRSLRVCCLRAGRAARSRPRSA